MAPPLLPLPVHRDCLWALWRQSGIILGLVLPDWGWIDSSGCCTERWKVRWPKSLPSVDRLRAVSARKRGFKVANKPDALPEGVTCHGSSEPEFIGQQAGIAADLLHEEFRLALAALPQVERAYFCKMRYPQAEQIEASVCVACKSGEDRLVVEALVAVIRDNLNSGSHIDILFLSPSLESKLNKVCQPFYQSPGMGPPQTIGDSLMTMPPATDASAFLNLTCEQFMALSEAERRLFVIGVANGRGMVAGLYQAYAGAAQEMASTIAEREAIGSAYHKIHQMIEPVLRIEAMSLFNGINAACVQPQFRGKLVMEALAQVHLDAIKALRPWNEQQ